MKWMMNPDNNPIMLLVVLALFGLCFAASFLLVTP